MIQSCININPAPFPRKLKEQNFAVKGNKKFAGTAIRHRGNNAIPRSLARRIPIASSDYDEPQEKACAVVVVNLKAKPYSQITITEMFVRLTRYYNKCL
jgi:hypothetical protein